MIAVGPGQRRKRRDGHAECARDLRASVKVFVGDTQLAKAGTREVADIAAHAGEAGQAAAEAADSALGNVLAVSDVRIIERGKCIVDPGISGNDGAGICARDRIGVIFPGAFIAH